MTESTVWAGLIALVWAGAIYKAIHTIVAVRRARQVRQIVLARLNGPRS